MRSFDLDRFTSAQGQIYREVLSEIKSGRKQSHWMWYVFPQIIGLGVEPRLGIPPTPGHVRDLIDLMRRDSIRAIFAANYYSSNQINQVAERTDAIAVIVPENTEGAEGTDTYFELVDTWIDNLSAAYR